MTANERRRRGKRTLEIPVGLEKLLFLAARDHELERRLIEDRGAVAEELGIRLRPSEQGMLAAITGGELRSMIRSLVPENPRRRRLMKVVAAAAASLAAGTATIGCDVFESQSKGCTGDDLVDGSFDAGADTDPDTADTDTETVLGGGALVDDDVDGDFEPGGSNG